MRYATYTLRIEIEELHTDEDLTFVQENLGGILSTGESLIEDALPEGWHAKFDALPAVTPPSLEEVRRGGYRRA